MDVSESPDRSGRHPGETYGYRFRKSTIAGATNKPSSLGEPAAGVQALLRGRPLTETSLEQLLSYLFVVRMHLTYLGRQLPDQR